MDSSDIEKNLAENNLSVVEDLVKETDSEKVKDLTNLFNLNMIKKNTLRVLKLNELLDKVSDCMTDRFRLRSDEFSNKDLIDYMSTISSVLDKTQKNVENVDNVPTITYNQQNNQVNISIADELPRESREKITEAISAIINRIQKEDSIININNELQENVKDGSN